MGLFGSPITTKALTPFMELAQMAMLYWTEPPLF
jgi:hypothetical protein